MPTNQRPGVYTSYEVSSAIAGGSGSKTVGIAAAADSGTAGQCYYLNTYTQAVEIFGGESAMTRLVKLLFLNGAPKVIASPVDGSGNAGAADYASAFELMQSISEIGVLVCDTADAAVHTAMRTSIATAPESCKYRVGIVEAQGTVTQLVEAAKGLNHERIVVAAPYAVASSGENAQAGSVAAAMAGLIASASDPAVPLNGAEIYGLEGLNTRYGDSEINTLVLGGVSVVESVSGVVTVVRAVTSRTMTGEADDNSWRELTTTLIVDDVLPTIKSALRSRFARAKNTAQVRGAIRTQVIIELESKLNKEIITGYDNVTVTVSDTDPTACEVSFDFAVAHGLNHIYLTANITV